MIDDFRSKELGECGVVGVVRSESVGVVSVNMTQVAFDQMIRMLNNVSSDYRIHADRFTDAYGTRLLVDGRL